MESFKLGVGSIKYKKIKLCFTIFLTVFSLLFLSITSSLTNYDINLAHIKLLKDREENSIQIEKYYLSEEYFINRCLLDLEE